MNKSIIIIGEGIAGLSTGCYSRMNGFDTTIFEMHTQPGGLCTAWKRGVYIIDGCLSWLVGSGEGTAFYRYWHELGALKGKQIINMDQFYRCEDARGKAFTLYTDIDKLEQHMKEIAPEDTAFINQCTNVMRKFTRFEMPPDKAPELYSIGDVIKMLVKMAPYMGDYNKWSKISMEQFAMRFKNPLLRRAWQSIWMPEFSSVFMLQTIAWLNNKIAGYVIGGSMEISNAVEKRYLDLGGKINYKSRVAKILVENNRAIGIKLEDGSEHRADYVISAADGHATLWDMLEGRYLTDKIKGYYEKLPIFQPLIYIGLGINRSFDDIPKIISGIDIPLDSPATIAGKERTSVSARIHNFDPTLAPKGKTLVTCMMMSDFSFWESLRKDMKQYKAEKERIADIVIAALDKRFPGLAQQVEMRDVATPFTFYRYTGNWQGSFEGWLMTPENSNLRMSLRLPGLDNFYMAGQWVMPGGGLPSGVLTGRWVTQMICKKEKQPFETTIV